MPRFTRHRLFYSIGGPAKTPKIGQLPGELRREVEDFVEFLLEKHRRAEQEQQAIARSWPAGYFEQTAGSLPDFPNGGLLRGQ
jgi:hypothetical protein